MLSSPPRSRGSRGQSIRRFLWVTLGFCVGAALAVALGLAVGITVAGPFGALVGSAALGAVVGVFEQRVLQRAVGLRWIAVTSLAASVGWFAGSAVGYGCYRLGVPQAGIALHAPVTAAVLAGAQAWLLKGGDRSRWFKLATLGWSTTLLLLLVPNLPPLVRVVALFVPGLVACLQAQSAAAKPSVRLAECSS